MEFHGEMWSGLCELQRKPQRPDILNVMALFTYILSFGGGRGRGCGIGITIYSMLWLACGGPAFLMYLCAFIYSFFSFSPLSLPPSFIHSLQKNILLSLQYLMRSCSNPIIADYIRSHEPQVTQVDKAQMHKQEMWILNNLDPTPTKLWVKYRNCMCSLPVVLWT